MHRGRKLCLLKNHAGHIDADHPLVITNFVTTSKPLQKICFIVITLPVWGQLRLYKTQTSKTPLADLARPKSPTPKPPGPT